MDRGRRGRGRGRYQGGQGRDGGGRGGRGRYEGGRGGRDGGGRGGRGRDGGGRGGGQHIGWTSVEQAQQQIDHLLANKRITAPPQSIKKFEDLEEGKFVPRPEGGGTIGRRIKVRTNFYAMQCDVGIIYHYDVEIRQHGKPRLSGEEGVEEIEERLPSKMNRLLLEKCPLRQPVGAYDGKKNLYTSQKLFDKKTETFTVVNVNRGREQKFDVKIALASTLNTADARRYLEQGNIQIPHKLLTALEICLKDSFANDPQCSCFGRSIYFKNQNKTELFGGSELWQGHIQSVRLTENGLALNLDLAYAVFLKEQPVLDYILTLENKGSPNDLRRMGSRWKKLGREIKGLNIYPTHLREGKSRPKKCIGFTSHGADDMRFPKQDGTQETVAGYWSSKYGRLQYPWLPCLDVSKGKKLNYLPIEVCNVAPGQRKAKLTPDLTRELIKTSARRPNDRYRGIRDVLQRSRFNQNPSIASFGLSVDNNEQQVQLVYSKSDELKYIVQVEARVLPQPYLQYGKPTAMDTGNRGAWNLEDVELLKGGNLNSWAVASFVNNTQHILGGQNGLEAFIHGLTNMMAKMGISVQQGRPPIVDGGRRTTRETLVEAVQQAQKTFGQPPQIVLAVLPRKDSWPYKEIKRVAEGDLGIMTQCFVTASAGIGRPPKGQLQYMANLVLKINQKIEGRNCKLVRPLSQMFPPIGGGSNKPYIVFGADVTHPTSFDASEPSVGALVASMDIDLSTYCARPVFLPHRQETLDMQTAIRDLLQCFLKKNRVQPEVVIFYRDGVSDGQFEPVLHHEYNEFQEAFRSLNENYRPPITYIVVKKRHHARMFPAERDGDRNGNAQPGTIIDSGITSKYDYDFYLNSQAGIQGTNKPAHYYALLDENGFGSDGLQLFTYWMCYLYCRCTRSVSYAPPAYYAHLAALHGKYLTQSSDSDVSSAVEGQPPAEYAMLHNALKERMFFV